MVAWEDTDAEVAPQAPDVTSIEPLSDEELPLQGAAIDLQRKLAKLHNMRATFEHTTIDPAGKVVDQSSGSVFWMKPMSFRWDVVEPFRQSIVLHDDRHSQYDEDLEQLVVREISDEVAALPELVLSGDSAALAAAYQVTEIKTAVSKNNQIQAAAAAEPAASLFKLVPKADVEEPQAVLLTFSGELLSEISILDSLGQTSRFGLASHELGNVVAEEFTIKVGEFTDVLYQ